MPRNFKVNSEQRDFGTRNHSLAERENEIDGDWQNAITVGYIHIITTVLSLRPWGFNLGNHPNKWFGVRNYSKLC
jgi:hypothetical protein